VTVTSSMNNTSANYHSTMHLFMIKRNVADTVDDRLCRSSIKTLNAFLRRYKRYGFCPPDMMTFKQLLKEADRQLFNKLCNNADDCLRSLLPALSPASQHYQLRQRAHNRDIPERTGHLTDSRALYT